MSVSNRLYGFIPQLLQRVVYAKSHGIPRFKFRHLNGDMMFVTLHPNGRIEVVREITSMGGKKVEGFPFRLETTEEQLRRDLADGIVTQQAEDFRG